MDKKNKDGVKIFLVTKDKKYILIERADSSYIDFPGGIIEKSDDDALSAGIREFEEETGIPFSEIENSAILIKKSLYTQYDGSRLYSYLVKIQKTSEELEKLIPKNILEFSKGETKRVLFLGKKKIFEMRQNEVSEKGNKNERMRWGTFKPFLALLDEKGRNKTEKLSEAFNKSYGPYRFYR